MSPLPEQSDMSRTLISLIDILFVVVIAASFAFYGSYLFRPTMSLVVFVGLVTVYLMAIASWIGYHGHITEYPYTESREAEARFAMHLALVAMCAYLLYSLGTAQPTPDLSPFLWGFPIIVVFYLISRRMRQKEYEIKGIMPEAGRETLSAEAIELQATAWAVTELEATEEDLLYTYLSGFIALCLIYQFIALPAILATHGALNWVFIFLPLLAGIIYQQIPRQYYPEGEVTAPPEAPPPAPTLPKRRIVNFRRQHGLPPPGSLSAWRRLPNRSPRY